ncbi:protein kinase family protein [Trebonia kvetii]|uniref:protein kinase family protein n=1 Tax=Trebonia kvetii TaxID=2480626 RepID=UPI001652B010|nr:protein kinase family protein [Trebonia kvetii]
MSTYISEPGTRLAGRYRLVDQVSAGNGWTQWKAIDETLARPVSVLTFAQGFPRISQVVTAARAASRLTDPRMAQVFDVEDGGGQAYIVLEWVGGDSLGDMLDGGTLEPARACSLISDASRAIAGAHAVGQAHLRLTPDAVRWTRGSGVKITGLGIDAALAGDGLTGPAAHDPSVADTTALAALLYAALTGYWPGEEPTRLPAAPVSDGVVCTPRQVSADVSSPLDSVITRALLQRPTRQGPPIQSPGDFADALAMVAPPPPLPEPAPAAPPGYQDRRGYEGYGYADPNNPDTWQTDRGHGGTAPYPPPSSAFPMAAYGGGAQYTGAQRPAADFQGRERGGPSRVMLAVVIVLVLAVIGATVWAIGFRKSGTPSAGGGSHPSTSAPAAAGSTVLTPTGVSTFNILGTDNEDGSTAQQAIDGSLSTAWATSYYLDNPKFGGIKTGTGLLIDMGKQVRLSQVEVLFGTDGATTAEIYLGNSAAMSKGALSNFTRVSPSASATGKHDFPVSSPATGRYVLIWLTSLPKLPKTPSGAKPGHTYYQASIYNVVVRGSAASGSS